MFSAANTTNMAAPRSMGIATEALGSIRKRACQSLSAFVACLLTTGNLWIVDLPGQFAAAAESETRGGTSHQPFDEVLQKHVADGEVDYPAIAQDGRFAGYVKQLKAKPAGITTREDRLAYWINAYNALAIQGILDGKSPSSLFGRYRYFKSTTYEVGGMEINLYDLERDVLIPLGEPRIHFAIVCASASCPKLISEAYTTEKLEQQLEDNTKRFINDSSRNRFDRNRKIAYLSKIFDWFEEDFEKHSGSVQRYVARYVDDPELAKELRNGDYEIEFLTYDWSLNGIQPKR